MYKNKRIVGIIPARGGSKGLPGKNIKSINGKPLINWTIDTANRSKLLDYFFVSTDDEDIKKVALEYGAKVIDRPKELAEDGTLDIDAMKHAVEYLKDYEDIVHLRATTPMIESDVLDKAIKFFFDNPDCTSLRSAHKSPETAYKSFKKKWGKYWDGLFNDEFEGEYYNLPRQQLPKTYQPNGYIDIVKPTQFMNSDSFHGDKMIAFVTDFAHEVDTPMDFKILEAVYG